MNANFGIVLRKDDREKVLSQLPPQTKKWGEETVVVGKPRYVSPDLDEVEFEIYPVTKFIRSRLPASEQGAELEYVWMTGGGLDKYQSWAVDMNSKNSSVFEIGFCKLLSSLNFWVVIFAPEGERLGEVVAVDVDNLVQILRRCVRDLNMCEGFLAVSSGYRCA
ncbi:hypothetical protein HFK83_26330 [Ralstonia pseudosolanacearum]|uniref:hypothetical protein n=1 Tax=Ralstonia solanacearum species complex TaxID=3116862 RepID=UPI0020035929|nr:hypothetical protein [Ralstonia pseudosolanacearum]MCK4125839.1 hypothetical protein [Ralstonia pseudosolanacearum]